MVGLGGAGKITILFKLELGEVVTTITTIGTNLWAHPKLGEMVATIASIVFSVETVECEDSSFILWAVGVRTSSALCGIITSTIRTV